MAVALDRRRCKACCRSEFTDVQDEDDRWI